VLKPDEVIVVDASADSETAAVVAEFPWARRIPFRGGAGHMTSSRNVGLLHANGEIIAFVDDDADVRPEWLGGMLRAFEEPHVGAVAGRTCNGIPGEESAAANTIGRLLPSGEVTGNFAADPGGTIEVHHGIGANMAFRKDVLGRLGGFRDDFRGVGGVREDTDVFLRVRSMGCRVLFSAAAVVDHHGAPHLKGRRFDYRYMFWARHNHALLLARNFGLGSRAFRAWSTNELRRTMLGEHPNLLRRTARVTLGVVGVVAGTATSVWKAGWGPTDPARRDAIGNEIRRRLLANERES
jgi:GT2 family glycosyltransferase